MDRSVHSDDSTYSLPQIFPVSSWRRRYYSTDSVRTPGVKTLGSGNVVDCGNALDLGPDRRDIHPFLGDRRLACRPLIDCEFCRLVVAGKVAWSLYCPAATLSPTGSSDRITLRFRIPVHFCFQLCIYSWIPGCFGSSQGFRNAAMDFNADLHFAARCGMACESRTGCSLAQRRGNIVPYRSLVGQATDSLRLTQLREFLAKKRDQVFVIPPTEFIKYECIIPEIDRNCCTVS
jgi:hypothetical protein